MKVMLDQEQCFFYGSLGHQDQWRVVAVGFPLVGSAERNVEGARFSMKEFIGDRALSIPAPTRRKHDSRESTFRSGNPVQY